MAETLDSWNSITGMGSLSKYGSSLINRRHELFSVKVKATHSDFGMYVVRHRSSHPARFVVNPALNNFPVILLLVNVSYQHFSKNK